MVRTLPLQAESRPEVARILAMAAAIGVHALAFLLLLIPMTTPRPEANAVEPQPPWVQEIKITPPPLPPIVPVRRIQPLQPQVQPRVVPQITAPAVAPVIVENGSVAADPIADSPPSIADIPLNPGIPLAGVQLEYATAPPPPYPPIAARNGLQGQVLLKILVDTDGSPLDVQVSKSSGHRLLDDAARRFVLKRWRFKPAMRDGQAVQAYGLVPIDFSMQ